MTVTGTPLALLPGVMTLGTMRSRLAVFYSVDPTDTQVKAILDECIQTGYEKVMGLINMHSREQEVSFNSVNGTYLYQNQGIGIPTYVGYDGIKLPYLPMELAREKYTNFQGSWDSGSPECYSLYSFDGVEKKVYILPSPKEDNKVILLLCLKSPPRLTNDNDYPLLPNEWAWLVLERAKIERLRFEKRNEEYTIQLQEFAALTKVFIKRVYPQVPREDIQLKTTQEVRDYNAFRSRRV